MALTTNNKPANQRPSPPTGARGKTRATPWQGQRPQALISAATLLLSLTVSLHLTAPLKAQQRSPAHQAYCLDLERKLAGVIHGDTNQQDRASIRTNLRNVEQVFHRLNNEAERRGCYNYFLFSKELRRTPRCLRIDKKIRAAKRQLAALNEQLHRNADSKSRKRRRQEKIISALARNKCGQNYEQAARRQNSFSNWFSDGFFGGAPKERSYSREEQFQFATHRTLCVRLCDGYYFPISFATTTNRFSTDEQVCQSRCAAPARLFTHPNPGGTSEQMLAVDGTTYESMKNAWRFKKEFVKGCSCKANEYDPALLAAKPPAETQEQAPLTDKKSEEEKKPAPEKTSDDGNDLKKPKKIVEN